MVTGACFGGQLLVMFGSHSHFHWFISLQTFILISLCITSKMFVKRNNFLWLSSGAPCRSGNAQSLWRSKRDGPRPGERREADFFGEAGGQLHCPASRCLQGQGRSKFDGYASTPGTPRSFLNWWNFQKTFFAINKFKLNCCSVCLK